MKAAKMPPIVPTTNMQLKKQEPPPRPPAQAPQAPPPQAHAMLGGGPKGPNPLGARRPPSVEEVWQGAEGFGEGPSTIDPKNLAGELEKGIRDQGGVGRGPRTPIGPNTPGGGPPPQELPPDQTSEDAAYQAILDLLSGDVRDTGEEEDLIRQLMQENIGKGQADLNARMGAAGMGTSGALGAMSADMRAKASTEAAKGIMDVRQGARDEQFEKMRLGLEMELRNRGLELTEAQWGLVMDEMTGGADANHDGNITPDEQAAADARNQEDSLEEYLSGLEGHDYSVLDQDAGAGTIQEPFKMSQAELDEAASQYGLQLQEVPISAMPGAWTGDSKMYKDQHGNYYVILDPGLNVDNAIDYLNPFN